MQKREKEKSFKEYERQTDRQTESTHLFSEVLYQQGGGDIYPWRPLHVPLLAFGFLWTQSQDEEGEERSKWQRGYSVVTLSSSPVFSKKIAVLENQQWNKQKEGHWNGSLEPHLDHCQSLVLISEKGVRAQGSVLFISVVHQCRFIL